MMEWLVAPGPASVELANTVGKKLDAKLLDVEIRVFPDGESVINVVGEVTNKRVLLLQSLYPPVDTHLIQALMLSHRLSQDGAEVYVAMPYLGYARQDKEFVQGEIVSVGVIARLLRAVGVKRLVTVDIHSIEGLGHFSFPTFSLSAFPLLAEYVKKNYRLERAVAASPDLGGSARIEAFARVLGIEHFVLKKSRDRKTGDVTVEGESIPELDGKDVIFVDDIISTGTSICRGAEVLKKSNPRSLYAVCTHPLLVDGALDRLYEVGIKEVIGTNTIPGPISKIDVAPLYSEYFSSVD